MNDESVLVTFTKKMVGAIVRNALIGALIMIGIGIAIYALSIATNEAITFSMEGLWGIVRNYGTFGLLGGGIIGIMYGIMAQRDTF